MNSCTFRHIKLSSYQGEKYSHVVLQSLLPQEAKKEKKERTQSRPDVSVAAKNTGG